MLFSRPPNPFSLRATASFVGKCRPQWDYGEIWLLVTSRDVIFDLSEKMTEVLSVDLLAVKSRPRARVKSGLAALRVAPFNALPPRYSFVLVFYHILTSCKSSQFIHLASSFPVRLLIFSVASMYISCRTFVKMAPHRLPLDRNYFRKSF